MRPQELIDACQEQIDICGPDAEKVLILPGRYGKRDYRTLFGVRGEIVQEVDGGIIVVFPAQKLKDAVEKKLQELKM